MDEYMISITTSFGPAARRVMVKGSKVSDVSLAAQA